MDLTAALAALNVPASYITGLIALASILAAVLPQAPAGSAWEKPRKLLDLLAMNWRNAANVPKA